jgi:hypothetical protein
MATQNQIQANRNNAQKSTGPRTEEGKAHVSQNALKHGLLARDAVLPGEDPAEFDAQLAALEDALHPEDALEQELVRQIADAQWRMQRLARLETAYLNAALDNQREIKAGPHPRPRHYSDKENTLMLGYSLMAGASNRLAQLARYDAHLSRRFERALQQIARTREAREKRHAAAARQTSSAVHKPAGPANCATPRPSNGTSPKPAHIPETLAPASEANNQTKPISPNHNEINEISPANRGQSHPLPAISQQAAPQSAMGASRPNHNFTVGTAPNHPHGPLPDQY